MLLQQPACEWYLRHRKLSCPCCYVRSSSGMHCPFSAPNLTALRVPATFQATLQVFIPRHFFYFFTSGTDPCSSRELNPIVHAFQLLVCQVTALKVHMMRRHRRGWCLRSGHDSPGAASHPDGWPVACLCLCSPAWLHTRRTPPFSSPCQRLWTERIQEPQSELTHASPCSESPPA